MGQVFKDGQTLTANDVNLFTQASDLAASTGAALVGSTDGTVQGDINARPTSASLAASGGANLSGFSASNSTSGTVARALVDRGICVTDAPFNADPTGVADSTPAFDAAPTLAVIPAGTYKTNTAPTGPQFGIAYDATFTGTSPYGSWMPNFGANPLTVFASAGANSIIGAALNDKPASSANEPCGITGYGRTNNAGNLVFGVFGRADLYNTGVATNEVDSFNFFGAPSTNLPPSRGSGTTQTLPIALTVAAGGTYNSAIGLQIAKEGSQPQQFLTGIYINDDACATYGILVDASAASTMSFSALLKHKVGVECVRLQGVGTPVPTNNVLLYQDGSGNANFAIQESGQLYFTSSLVGATATAGTLGSPGNYAAYLSVQIGASTYKIPLFNN